MKNKSLFSDEAQKEVTRATTQCFQKSEVSGVGQIISGDLKEATALTLCLVKLTLTTLVHAVLLLTYLFPLRVCYWCLFFFLCIVLATKKHCLDPRAVFIATSN